MSSTFTRFAVLLGLFCLASSVSWAQGLRGSIRGVVIDSDFQIPLEGVRVVVVETQLTAQTSAQGIFLLPDLEPGVYTLTFSLEGFTSRPLSEVVVRSGDLTEVEVGLAGEFNEMDELVVEETLNLGAGTEAQLLQLRFESPALLDSIGSELMSRAGASDAASALRLVSGASVADNNSAVIRGLPDRYVSSQLNGLRVPSADEDRRAVELDQFPATVIESIQVSKTFTPDQQGEASGGAVDIRLKGVPDEASLAFKGQYGFNSTTGGRSDFLTYDDGGLNFLGDIDDERDPQPSGENWDGSVGVREGNAPIDYKWSLAGGSSFKVTEDVTIGGFASIFYERDSQHIDDGVNDSYWVSSVGEGLSPRFSQGTPQEGDFLTSLFDVVESSQSVQWGGLGSFGLETENHALSLTYLYTRSTEDKATLAEDTRGKEYYFPGYDPDDLDHPGNDPDALGAAPYIRTETLTYTERQTGTVQLGGDHVLPIGEMSLTDWLVFQDMEFDWAIADSFARSNQPDRRDFGAIWVGASLDPGAPPFLPPFRTPPTFFPFRPDANVNLGNLNRIYKRIDEESEQYTANLTWPFEMWDSAERGYLKAGVFSDEVTRTFDQDTFRNVDTEEPTFFGDFDEFWSEVWEDEDHPIGEALVDVDYDGELNVSAYYGMADIPVTETLHVIGGARFETTEISVVNEGEEFAFWFPPGFDTPTVIDGDAEVSPDVDFEEDKILPAIALSYDPFDDESLTLRTSYSRTIARQTFKELTPIIQQEFLGGPIFIGNPGLQTAKLENYDVRLDYKPYEGGLISLSWFHKEIEDPIEYVQRVVDFEFTTPVNYPEGELTGFEIEVRQQAGQLWEPLEGIQFGANATIIDSEVTLPADEAALLEAPNIQAPMPTRDATDAPEHLYNLFLTYDLESTGTRFGLFYTIQGDTLISGATQSENNFIPNIYAKEFDTLNFSVSQRLGSVWNLTFQAKNLTNPRIETVYRSRFIGDDVTRTKFTRGIDYSISLGAQFSF